MLQLKHGILISVEGIDGSGKSTLARALHAKLSEHYATILTKEPGGTPFGQKLRTILQDPATIRTAKAEYLLFAADRAQHFAELIIPQLAQGKIIISDRMADSSLVYQGYGRGLSHEMITSINRWAMNDVTPDLTIYAKISLETARQRLKSRQTEPTSFEQEHDSFTQRLIDGFDELFSAKEHVITLDACQSAEHLANAAYQKVISWINAHHRS